MDKTMAPKKRKAYFVVAVGRIDGATYLSDTFYATGNGDAVKQARAEMSRKGHTRHDGPMDYRATRTTESE